jgi:hypothetical protein
MRLKVCAACLVLAAACAPRGPVIGTTAVPDVGGTIAGAVRGSGGATPLPGRKVTVINEASGARFETSTGANGGYTVKVPAGNYRLEVELREGEAVEEQPPATEVNVGDLDPDRDFVLTVR